MNIEHKTCDAPVNVEIGTPNEIVFCAEPEKWVMKLTADKGIQFNRDQHLAALPDDFAKAVIEILEKNFSVTFRRRREPVIAPDNKQPPLLAKDDGNDNTVNFEDAPETWAYALKEHWKIFTDHSWKAFSMFEEETRSTGHRDKIDKMKWREYLLWDMYRRHKEEEKDGMG